MLNNSSLQQKLAKPYNFWAFALPPHIFLCILSLVTNGFILIACRWLKRPLTPIICMTVSLCGSDFWMSLCECVSVVLIMYLPLVHYYYSFYNYCFLLVLVIVRWAAAITAVLHLLAMTVHHYVGITRPLHYAATMNPERTQRLIAVLWIAPFSAFALVFSIIPGQAFQSDGCKLTNFYKTFSFRITIALIIVLPLIIMCCLYAHIIIILIKRNKQQHLLHMTQSCEARMNSAVKTEKTTALYVGTFVLGWVPGIVIFCLTCHGCPLYRWTGLKFVRIFVNTLTVCKSLCNAFVYAARVKEIRQAIKAMCKACRNVTERSEPGERIELRGRNVSSILDHRKVTKSSCTTLTSRIDSNVNFNNETCL